MTTISTRSTSVHLSSLSARVVDSYFHTINEHQFKSPCLSSTLTPRTHVSASCTETLKVTALENTRDTSSSVLAATTCQQSHVSGTTFPITPNEDKKCCRQSFPTKWSERHRMLDRLFWGPARPALTRLAPCIPTRMPTGHNVVLFRNGKPINENNAASVFTTTS